MEIRILNSGTQTEIQRVNLDTLLAEGESCFVGRSQNSGLVLDSANVSRLHGKLARREGQVYFSDLGSTNGTMVQDHIAAVNQDYTLHAGDTIYIGGFTLIFEDSSLKNPVAAAIESQGGAVKSTLETISNTVPDIASETISNTASNTASETISDTASDKPKEPVELIEAELVEAELVEAELVEAEIVPESSGAIVPYQSGSITPRLEAKTRALLNVIQRRAIADLRITGKFTREAFLKAVQTARESIEEHIDQEQLEQEVEKYWQSMTKTSAVVGTRLGESAAKGASELGSRLGAAAKAAWKEFVSTQKPEPPSKAVLENPLPTSSSENPPVPPGVEEESNQPGSKSLN